VRDLDHRLETTLAEAVDRLLQQGLQLWNQTLSEFTERVEQVVAELLPNYGADCPVAVVARASRPDEVILRGTLADIAGRVREAGVRRVLLTHPGYRVPVLSAAETRQLTDLGAYAEVTAVQLLDEPGAAAALAAFVRDVGYERVVLSSDTGQPHNPTPPEALHRLVDALAAEGLDRKALLACASETPERLVTP